MHKTKARRQVGVGGREVGLRGEHRASEGLEGKIAEV